MAASPSPKAMRCPTTRHMVQVLDVGSRAATTEPFHPSTHEPSMTEPYVRVVGHRMPSAMVEAAIAGLSGRALQPLIQLIASGSDRSA